MIGRSHFGGDGPWRDCNPIKCRVRRGGNVARGRAGNGGVSGRASAPAAAASTPSGLSIRGKRDPNGIVQRPFYRLRYPGLGHANMANGAAGQAPMSKTTPWAIGNWRE